MPTMTLSAFPIAMMMAASVNAAATWTPTGDLPSKSSEAGMASLGNGLVVLVGGGVMGGKGPLKSAALYDSKTGKWSAALPALSTPREMAGTCVIKNPSVAGGGTIYALGGVTAYAIPPHSAMNVTASAEALQFVGPAVMTSWKPAPKLPSARTAPSVTSLPDGTGCIIAAGFSDSPDTGHFEYLTDAYLFDGKTYKKLPDIPYPRSNMGIAVTKSGAYIIGGGEINPSYFNVSYLQLKPTIGAAWKAVAPLNYARSYSMVGALTDPKSGEEVIVAAGGMSLNPMFDPMASVEIYSPQKDSWTLIDDGEPGALPTPIGFGAGAPINETHMLVAGGVGAGTTGTEALVFHL